MDKHKVFKYGFPFEKVDSAFVDLPMGAEILPLVDVTEGRVWFWAAVDPSSERPTQRREFFLVGTGHEYSPLGARHIASLVQNSGYMKFVWHLFEREQQ